MVCNSKSIANKRVESICALLETLLCYESLVGRNHHLINRKESFFFLYFNRNLFVSAKKNQIGDNKCLLFGRVGTSCSFIMPLGGGGWCLAISGEARRISLPYLSVSLSHPHSRFFFFFCLCEVAKMTVLYQQHLFLWEL